MPDVLMTSALIAAALAGSASLTLYATFVPQSAIWGTNISRGPSTDPPRIALTFDDGPTEPYTSQVLDILREMEVKAAFFMIGSNIERAPDVVRRVADEGHLIGNHSYTHGHSGVMHGEAYWRSEIDRTDQAIQRLIGQRPSLFRPPMGMKTWLIAKAVRERSHTMITWSQRAMDGVPTTPQRILGRLVPRVRAGDIIALHDGVDPNHHRTPHATVEALRPLILALRDRGLGIVRLDELLDLPASRSHA